MCLFENKIKYVKIILGDDIVYVKQGENELSLILPRNWSEKHFPKGEHYGTVFYSKESKVILYFSPKTGDGSLS